MKENGNFIDHQKTYYYPKYVPSQQIIKGLYFTEWLAVVVPVAFGLMFFQIIGMFVGLVIAGGLFFLFFRQTDERTNLAHEMTCVYNYYGSTQKFRKKSRDQIKGDGIFMDEKQEDTVKKKRKTNKSKKGNKKNQKKQEKNMEDLFPFKSINDGYIEMENGDHFLFFKIQANNLDLLSERDLDAMIGKFSHNLDTNKYKISFFIQDSLFKIKNNLEEIQRCREKVKVPFLRRLLDQNEELIKEEKNEMNKKSNYIRIHVSPKKVKVINVEEIQSRVVKNFRESLDPLIVSRDELKQILAIYGNRLFADELPDIEYQPEIKEEKSLLRRKKKKYKETQLPGIYNFKNMIVPINADFRPSSADIGNNTVKTYAVSSFLGSTQYTNLLSKVCAIRGVTTMIYLTDLNLSRFRDNASLQVKADGAQATDSFDAIDATYNKNNLEGTYKRAKENKQKMYYVSIYFQLSAKTKNEFKELEELFLQEINDQNITIDPLKSQQKDGYLTASPIGYDRLGNYTKQNVPSESVANLYPFNEPSLLDPTGLPIGNVADSKLMMLFDPFSYRGSNYNMLVLGQSGMGKTVLMMLIMQLCACKSYYIRNIDFEGVYVKFFERIGGINVDVSGGNEFCINPLQIRIPDHIKTTLIDDYISEVVKFMSVYKPSWSNDALDLFQHCLKKTYDRFHITNDIEVATLAPDKFPILSDVVETIKEERKRANEKDSIAKEEMYQSLQRGLLAATEGADACMFNRHTNLGSIDMNDIPSINFDMSQIMTSDTARKLAQQINVFTYISQFVNSNMDHTKYILVGIDELDKCLSKEFMPIISTLNDYERRFRKRNASLMKGTQTMDEVNTKIPELEAKVKPLFSQPAIKFLFHLGDIDYEQPQKMMGLTETEINRLKINRNGKCLMKVNQAIYDLDVLMPVWFKEVKTDVKEKGAKHA